ncbi:MAG: DUF3800 domain-containing protein, partial [Polyangiaceae bacterium]|nr:DUF3800 domain-containing protein [Polyangiaceae bacterium]
MTDENRSDELAVPGHKNFLVYCDESGIDGQRYYGFGSLWMPWERRGDFCALVRRLREAHRYMDEIKWQHVNRRSAAFYVDLVDTFFSKTWLMFHALVVRKGYTDAQFHRDFDEEKRKRFAMLVGKKIQYFSDGRVDKSYHVRVDPLPSRYAKADQAAFKIAGATLKKTLGIVPLKSLITRDSRATPGIQVSDLLLGALMSEWQGTASSEHKLRVRATVAGMLGWPDLRADTHPGEWKFNAWYFYDPSTRMKREVKTRPVTLKYAMP